MSLLCGMLRGQIKLKVCKYQHFCTLVSVNIHTHNVAVYHIIFNALTAVLRALGTEAVCVLST